MSFTRMKRTERIAGHTQERKITVKCLNTINIYECYQLLKIFVINSAQKIQFHFELHFFQTASMTVQTEQAP